MMLGSSLEAAAPAKALPSAEALFSRIWKPDPHASPKNASAVVATAISIASHLTQSSTASPNVSPQNGKTKRRTQTVNNLIYLRKPVLTLDRGKGRLDAVQGAGSADERSGAEAAGGATGFRSSAADDRILSMDEGVSR